MEKFSTKVALIDLFETGKARDSAGTSAFAGVFTAE